MRYLDWENYYNEFSKTQGRQARGNGYLFRIFPQPGGKTELRMISNYTGEFEVMHFSDVENAITSADQINRLLGNGYELKSILAR